MADEENGRAVSSVAEMTGRGETGLTTLMGNQNSRILCPALLEQLERECIPPVHLQLTLVLCGLVAAIAKYPEFRGPAKNSRVAWFEPSADAMLNVPSRVAGDPWDERVRVMRHLRRSTGTTDWTWRARPMSVKPEADNATAV